MKKRMEQIEEILSCEENSAVVRLKELVEALELEVTNKNLLKVTSILHMNPKVKKIYAYEDSRVITLYQLLQNKPLEVTE